MIDEKLKLKINGVISDTDDWNALLNILRNFKMNGGKQSDAMDTLQSMRINASEEYEDRVLEIMDIASGFCAPKYKVWQD